MRYLTTPQLQQFGQLPIIGGRDCESATKTPQHGESFKIGDRISVKALHTPCHTQDSVCYFMEDGDQRVVFTGDTLFIGGMFYVVGFNVLGSGPGADPCSQAAAGSSRGMRRRCTKR
jgi:glyoxylase-like metal-dependent hydrolase (beta-lactamase superfamily II)